MKGAEALFKFFLFFLFYNWIQMHQYICATDYIAIFTNMSDFQLTSFGYEKPY